MSEEPEFDIYPDLERDIKEATGEKNDTMPEDVAVGGLAEVVGDTIGAGSRVGYEEAEKRVQALFEGFPEDERFQAYLGINRIRKTEQLSGMRLEEELRQLDKLREQIEGFPWYRKLVSLDDRAYLKQEGKRVSKINEDYNQVIEKSKEDVEPDQQEALLTVAMTEVYNKISAELGKVYGVETAELNPAQLSREIDQTNTYRRSVRGDHVSMMNTARLDSASPKKQVVALALKNIFTTKGKQTEEQAREYKPPRPPREFMGGSLADAEAKARDMQSEYVLRVRQAIDGSFAQASTQNREPESFIAIDNFTAALINYLLQGKDGQLTDEAIRAVGPLDSSGNLDGNDPTINSHQLYAVYDLLDLTKAESDDGFQMNLAKAA